MLEEAIEVIRKLWKGGMQSHQEIHYTVENARIYDLPEQSPPIIVSGFGPKSTKLAAEIGDGFCTVSPEAEAVAAFRRDGGEGKLVAGGMKVCWAEDESEARATAHRLWPNEHLPGELAQVLPQPAHFEQACELVDEEMVADEVTCGPDLDRHREAIQRYADAGFDELYIQQIGSDQERFFEIYADEVLPAFRQNAEGES